MSASSAAFNAAIKTDAIDRWRFRLTPALCDDDCAEEEEEEGDVTNGNIDVTNGKEGEASGAVIDLSKVDAVEFDGILRAKEGTNGNP